MWKALAESSELFAFQSERISTWWANGLEKREEGQNKRERQKEKGVEKKEGEAIQSGIVWGIIIMPSFPMGSAPQLPAFYDRLPLFRGHYNSANMAPTQCHSIASQLYIQHNLWRKCHCLIVTFINTLMLENAYHKKKVLHTALRYLVIWSLLNSVQYISSVSLSFQPRQQQVK